MESLTTITPEQLAQWKKIISNEFKHPVSSSNYYKKRKVHPWLPPYHQLVKAFGSWPAAMSVIFGEEAPVYRINWSKADILKKMQEAIEEKGDYLSVTQYDQWHREKPNTPSVRTIERQFGSYRALMIEIGQNEYRGLHIMSRAEVEACLKRYFQDKTHSRTLEGYLMYRRASDQTLPSESMIRRYYGTWREMLTIFGEKPLKGAKVVEKPLKRITTVEWEAFEQLMTQLEPPISSRRYREIRAQQENPRLYPSYERLKRQYGGWSDVLKTLKIGESHPTARKVQVGLFSQEQTARQLRHYFKTVEHPTYLHYVAYAKQKNRQIRQQATMAEIKQYYGNWECMLKQLNLQVIPKSYCFFESKEIIQALQTASLQLGLPLTIQKYEAGRQTREEMKGFPSRKTIIRQFGSWKDALEAAGIDTSQRRSVWANEFKESKQSIATFLNWCLE